MRIGLTYDLRAEYLAEGYSEEETAEFDRPDTIDALEAALARRLHTWRRNGRRGLGANGATGSFALRVGFMIRWSLGRRRPGWAALTLSGDAL